MGQQVYSAQLVWTDGKPLVGAILAVAKGTAPIPEIAHRSDNDGNVTLSLPRGVFEMVILTPAGRLARAVVNTQTLSTNFAIRFSSIADGSPPGTEESMTTTISNIQIGSTTQKLGSVTNLPIGTEVARAAKTLAKLDGHRGTARPGLAASSARAALVRGNAPLIRPKRVIALPESVIGPDERTQVSDTELDPWRMICSLEIRSRLGEFVGTGWFAGPKTVITAGHCVHHAQMGGWATEIVVRPGRAGAHEPFGAVASRLFSTTDRWFNEANPDFDYAAIHLGDDGPALTSQTGWFGTVVRNDAGLEFQRVNVAGYPGDKGGATQWFHAKQVVFVTQHRIFYDVDTMGGQSGAPAWLDTEEGPLVVGIHAYGTGASVASVEANSAPRITEPVLERIREWLTV